ncbi:MULTISPECIES: hypothetical protein [Hungatella]|uniref:hypothetical protein n=1 Tax=Hungatella TaxID=1649459 RepID=UPI002A8075E5|nr:hypothetical protein [Hungatella effluvii]
MPVTELKNTAAALKTTLSRLILKITPTNFPSEVLCRIRESLHFEQQPVKKHSALLPAIFLKNKNDSSENVKSQFLHHLPKKKNCKAAESEA